MRDRLAAESDEERETRLQRMRDRLAAESDEERETRLQRMRDRLAAESDEERETRLQRMRDRLAAESVEQREARLQQMSIHQRERRAAESAEEREARLQRMSALQRGRLAVETDEEREDRLQRAREQSSQVLLFEQHSIQVKMRRFHAHFALLDSSTCSTCLESFPGLQLHPPSTECVRCYRDKHAPKMYSSANNMDPGPLPTQLQVGTCICMQIPCSPLM